MPSATIPGEFLANLFPTSSADVPDTQDFVPRTTPGRIAVCLSGGGSRALSAGMGQLQALEMVQVNGASLLSQVSMISTVSGGGWVGIPFVYLTPKTPDGGYLGAYINPANLTLDLLETLSESSIGSRIISGFTLTDLALEAAYLYAWEGVPASMLWQTLIGNHILRPYGLFEHGAAYTPTSFFSYDKATLQDIIGKNPSLAAESANLVAQVAGQQRPSLVCNCALFVTTPSGTLLAPIQATSYATGMTSRPPNTRDANGRLVGGGGVTSFAFNSAPQASSKAVVQVLQSRQWSLMDIVGTSSAAFAAEIQELNDEWTKSPHRLAAAVRVRKEKVTANLTAAGADPVKVEAYLQSLLDAAGRGDLAQIKAQAGILESIIPAYQYWPVDNPPNGQDVAVTEFGDGGLLENCGIASILAFPDIDTLISFVNSVATLSVDDYGVIVVDDNIPPLFGFQPYNGSAGYVPYDGATDPYYPLFQNNQVFPSSSFQPLLSRLWEASGSGTYQTAPIVSQALTTVENRWWGVAPGRTVTVVWVHLEIASDWYAPFSWEVRLAMDTEIYGSNFPHYNTLTTELSPTQINLLANLTAWTVAAPENVGKFTSLFTP